MPANGAGEVCAARDKAAGPSGPQRQAGPHLIAINDFAEVNADGGLGVGREEVQLVQEELALGVENARFLRVR